MLYKKETLTLKGSARRWTNGNYWKTLAEKRGKWQSEANSDAGTVNRHCRHIRSSVRRKGKK